MPDDTDKGIKTNLAFPDSGVAVFVTAKRVEAVVQWMAFMVETDDAVELS